MNKPLVLRLLFFSYIAFQLLACQETSLSETHSPKVFDESLQLVLIDTAPNIMTPIGLAIDKNDHFFVLESHTHSPLKDYAGPKYDRIKKGIDEDGDGKPDSWLIFADSITDGMNLTIGPDNTLYLACKDKILAYQDLNQDGVSDQMKAVLLMRSSGNIYDHAGILGISFSPDGWLYLSRGNTGGQAWEMVSADGSKIHGYGDGGNVVRCRPDGTGLEEIATGFWNPFDLKFTRDGRLLLTDNDPDSRGPNRLIEVVDGADYGYQSLYGGSGIHPFLAWNGELPGTLPYAAALGEAPTGLIDAGFSNFGDPYQNNILVAVWEENSIVSIPLQKKGSSIQGSTEVLVKGDSTFHPVSFAINSKGELYFTDWVVRQYPNHGQGRLWRLSSKKNQTTVSQEMVPARDLISRNLNRKDPVSLINTLKNGDDFTKTVARKYLSTPAHQAEILDLLRGEDKKLCLEALLTLLHSDFRLNKSILSRLLQDESEAIRQMTLIYIARKSRADLSEDVIQALATGHITASLFETYLATIRHLQPDFINQYQNKSKVSSKQLKRNLPNGFLIELIQDTNLPAEIRAMALPYLEYQKEQLTQLMEWLKTSEAPIQLGLLQLFSQHPNPEVASVILDIIQNTSADRDLRTQALVSLSYQAENYCQEVAALLQEGNVAFQQVALRYLCRCSEEEEIQVLVNQFLKTEDSTAKESIRQIWQLCQGALEDDRRPLSPAAWEQVITGKSDATAGKWVFHSQKAQCQNCHKIDGWGGNFGPDLSHVGSSKSRQQLLTAILEPSKEISPEWQGWYIVDQAGKRHYGRQIDVGFKNAELLLESGAFVTFKEPKSYGMATTSLMPEGLEHRLTVAELNDLITYLIALK